MQWAIIILLCRTVVGAQIRLCGIQHRCKNVFFTFFNVFYFSNVFLFLKNVGKVQSGKQINKKHFQNNSNEIDWSLG